MNKEALVTTMDDISFFKEMTPAEREELLTHEGHWMQFQPNETILKEDEVDYGFFVLVEGHVSVMRSKPAEVSLAQLVPGSIFGEITLKAKRPRNSSIEADDEVTVFRVDNQLLDRLSPEMTIKIKDQILDLVISRLDEVNNRLSSFIR